MAAVRILNGRQYITAKQERTEPVRLHVSEGRTPLFSTTVNGHARVYLPNGKHLFGNPDFNLVAEVCQ